MATTCDQCRKPATHVHKTLTGREICDRCQDQLLGLSAGAIASGGDVGDSLATAGWFARLRVRRRNS